jgi:hypothetical protein
VNEENLTNRLHHFPFISFTLAGVQSIVSGIFAYVTVFVFEPNPTGEQSAFLVTWIGTFELGPVNPPLATMPQVRL